MPEMGPIRGTGALALGQVPSVPASAAEHGLRQLRGIQVSCGDGPTRQQSLCGDPTEFVILGVELKAGKV